MQSNQSGTNEPKPELQWRKLRNLTLNPDCWRVVQFCLKIIVFTQFTQNFLFMIKFVIFSKKIKIKIFNY